MSERKQLGTLFSWSCRRVTQRHHWAETLNMIIFESESRQSSTSFPGFLPSLNFFLQWRSEFYPTPPSKTDGLLKRTKCGPVKVNKTASAGARESLEKKKGNLLFLTFGTSMQPWPLRSNRFYTTKSRNIKMCLYFNLLNMETFSSSTTSYKRPSAMNSRA